MMGAMTVIAQVNPEKEQEFRQAMSSLYGYVEKGLKKSMLYQESRNPGSFRLIVEFESPGDLERHLGAEKFRMLLGTLKVLCEKSQIRYRKFSGKGA